MCFLSSKRRTHCLILESLLQTSMARRSRLPRVWGFPRSWSTTSSTRDHSRPKEILHLHQSLPEVLFLISLLQVVPLFLSKKLFPGKNRLRRGLLVKSQPYLARGLQPLRALKTVLIKSPRFRISLTLLQNLVLPRIPAHQIIRAPRSYLSSILRLEKLLGLCCHPALCPRAF